MSFLKLRSHVITRSKIGIERALMKAAGFTDHDLSKPLIGIANTWSENHPGHFHLRQLAQAVKRGVLAAGGTPIEFNTITICDGVMADRRYHLPCRDLIAMSTEAMINTSLFDACVFLSACDKVVPAQLMAAARVNIPSIFVLGGPMLPARFGGREDVTPSDIYHRIDTLSPPKMRELENSLYPSVGACGMLGTANTMQCFTEALGMALPRCATIPAVFSEKMRIAEESGRMIMHLLESNIRPSDIMTYEAFENAIRVILAMGGSTNACIHVPAIARELGINLTHDIFDELSRSTPYLCDLKPCGRYTIKDFDEAGGVPAVMYFLKDTLNLNVLTVTGKPLKNNLENIKPVRSHVIHPINKPILPEGGIIIVKGSLAPKGAVVRRCAVKSDMLKREGRAIVFNCLEDLVEAASSNASSFDSETIIVLRYEGAKGGPGMREVYIPFQLMARGLQDIPLITDGRISGSLRGTYFVHVCPEAFEGGPIAIVQDGDIISYDIEKRKLDLQLSEDEIHERLSHWRRPKPKDIKGYLGHYRKNVGPANEGARLI